MHSCSDFVSRGILSTGCSECSAIFKEALQKNEELNYIAVLVGTKCTFCGEQISACINGLHPHGISLRCECLNGLCKQFTKEQPCDGMNTSKEQPK